jgi:hypothetical protein
LERLTQSVLQIIKGLFQFGFDLVGMVGLVFFTLEIFQQFAVDLLLIFLLLVEFR